MPADLGFRLKSTKMSTQPFINFHRKSSYLSMSSHLRSLLKLLCGSLCSPMDCSRCGLCPWEFPDCPPLLLLRLHLKFSQLSCKETPFFSQLLLPQSQSILRNPSWVCCRISRIKIGKHISKGWDQDYETTKAFWGKGFEKEATRNCCMHPVYQMLTQVLHHRSSVYKNYMNLLQLKRAVVHPVGLNSRERLDVRALAFTASRLAWTSYLTFFVPHL